MTAGASIGYLVLMTGDRLDDAFLRKVREDHPAPIAQAARRFQAANGDARLTEAVNLVSTLVLTLGTVSLAWCQYRQLRPSGVQHWHDKFQRQAPVLGDWLGAARAGAKLAADIGVPLSGLEVALDGNGEGRLAADLDELVTLRNRFAHGWASWATLDALRALEAYVFRASQF